MTEKQPRPPHPIVLRDLQPRRTMDEGTKWSLKEKKRMNF